ncbi:MAG: ATP-binding cassette domain-containing protein, partial [Isosphaeraceae bacterium]
VLRIRVPALLEKIGLTDRAHEPIARFSKGMVQRLALAQALIAEPDLLVLDEPMEGLDLGARQLLQEIIEEQRYAGKAVLVVSHALGEVAQVCDRLAVPSRDGSPISVPWPPCCAIWTRAACGLSKRPWGQFVDPDGSAP